MNFFKTATLLVTLAAMQTVASAQSIAAVSAESALPTATDNSMDSSSENVSVDAGSQYPKTSYPSLYASIAPRRPAPTTITLQPNDDIMGMINNASGNVLIDFFADWCGPCHVQSAILDEMKPVVTKHGGLVIKVNVDKHPELAQRLQVSGLPTLMVVRDGKVIERKTGIADHRAIAGFLAR